MPNNENSKDYILEALNLSKSFGGVKALDNVDIFIKRNEIVCLLGDNGAGKSTFIKVIAGVFKPDKGQIFINGKKVFFNGPKESQRAGIETIYQDLALFNQQDITSNLFIGREIKRFGFILNKNKMTSLAKETLEKTGISIKSINQLFGELSGGQKHAVAIGRAVFLSGEPQIILMDEPTAGLGVRESNELLNIIKELKKSTAISVMLITHNLDHAFKVADRFVILRGGKKVAEKNIKETNQSEIVEKMIGVI